MSSLDLKGIIQSRDHNNMSVYWVIYCSDPVYVDTMFTILFCDIDQPFGRSSVWFYPNTMHRPGELDRCECTTAHTTHS